MPSAEADCRSNFASGDGRSSCPSRVHSRPRPEPSIWHTSMGLYVGDGREYTSRIQTRHGYATVRVPFNSFRPTEPGYPPLDPADAARLSARYEPRRSVAATIIGQQDTVAQ